ncbi:hypothetical protein FB451DRAFT_1373762 [Mycena latifolia]|nr:hypothetical protein FB451DRAFT_1373762 [Mycena latifolia]
MPSAVSPPPTLGMDSRKGLGLFDSDRASLEHFNVHLLDEPESDLDVICDLYSSIKRITCLAHVISLATQELISSYSKSPNFSPHDPEAHVPEAAPGSTREEIGLLRAIAVKLLERPSAKRLKELFKTIQNRSRADPAIIGKQMAVDTFIFEISQDETGEKRKKLAERGLKDVEWASVNRLCIYSSDRAKDTKYANSWPALEQALAKGDDYYQQTSNSNAYMYAMDTSFSRVYDRLRTPSACAFHRGYQEARKIKETQVSSCAPAEHGLWAQNTASAGACSGQPWWTYFPDVSRLSAHCYESKLWTEFKFHIAAQPYLVPDLLKKSWGLRAQLPARVGPKTDVQPLFSIVSTAQLEAYRVSDWGRGSLADNGLAVIMKTNTPRFRGRLHLLGRVLRRAGRRILPSSAHPTRNPRPEVIRGNSPVPQSVLAARNSSDCLLCSDTFHVFQHQNIFVCAVYAMATKNCA